MAALTKGRNTLERSGDITEPPVKGATKIFAGGLVAINASGLAVPMATVTTLVGLGRAEQTVDNSAGADGDKNVRVGRGIYKFANSSAGDLITRSDIGATCYGVDDQTVAKTNGTNTRSPAGKIHDVDADGVWVKFN
ncbi:hypothetical protein [Mesorhizobium qingshengii]|uniref:Bacteriophage lambda head decoration protein D n=1 Tax=Mesorhizobium qingshengii TaxID=1165689 RepID=A0A1G5V1D7_9HYPH|nr:hypothetical protein [Mesorhizobium qingshengii]SDA39196.1 hypothetical protein SAMN02927914_00122 [Mesorhizobium qingshengii]